MRLRLRRPGMGFRLSRPDRPTIAMHGNTFLLRPEIGQENSLSHSVRLEG